MTALNPLHFSKLGKGPNLLLAFHGVGQTGEECFKIFENILGDYYTIFAFDLPFHGKSDGQNIGDDFVIDINQWKHYLNLFLTENQIDTFDVTGFSIGGRLALATASVFPERINNLLLVAPEGLYIHPLYKIATYNKLMRSIFRSILNRPKLILMPIKLLFKTQLLSSLLLKFVEQMLTSAEHRQQIYLTWTTFRKLRFDFEELQSTLRQNQVVTWLFLGKNDFLLPYKKLEKEISLINKENVHIFPCGHFNLVRYTAVYLAQTLNIQYDEKSSS